MDTNSLTIDRNENLRFTLKHLFVVVALLAVALTAGRVTGSIVISIQLLVLVIGWIMHRFMHAHLGALIPCLLGFDYLAIRGVAWAYFGFEGFFDEFPNSAASILVLVGSSAFAYLATCKGPQARWQLIHAVTFFALLLAWWTFIPALGDVAVTRRRAIETAQNNAAMTQAVAQVEALRQKLGRVPSEADLNDHLKDGLPKIRSGSGERAISYNHVSDQEYHLWCLISSGDLWGDIHYYDSDQPQKGWQVEPF